MACYHPITGMRTPTGTISFKKAEGYYDRPVKIPCGQCSGCRRERARQWSIRCMNEAQMHKRNSFLTLTYDDEHLPGDESLRVEDWQNFAKRVRHKMGPFRFFHCGEYTDKGRPHYHALVFGHNFHQDRILWKTTKQGHPLYRSAQLEELWNNGFSTIGEVTPQSANYVARYNMKKVTGLNAQAHYTRINKDTGEEYQIKPEYTTMSRRPGIGADWIAKYNTDVYPRDYIVVKGKKQPTIKYYDEWLKANQPAKAADLQLARVKSGRKHAANKTAERLAVREKVQDAKHNLTTRDL